MLMPQASLSLPCVSASSACIHASRLVLGFPPVCLVWFAHPPVDFCPGGYFNCRAQQQRVIMLACCKQDVIAAKSHEPRHASHSACCWHHHCCCCHFYLLSSPSIFHATYQSTVHVVRNNSDLSCTAAAELMESEPMCYMCSTYPHPTEGRFAIQALREAPFTWSTAQVWRSKTPALLVMLL